MKVRPCKKGCGYPAIKGRQFCLWHALMREPAHVQAEAARRRLSSSPHSFQDSFRSRVPKAEWPDGERWCSGCQVYVPLFYTTGSRCKACASSAAHSGKVEATYGISGEEYDRMFAAQGGRCAICRNSPRSQRLAVDHDHKNGDVRGLLCKRCNHDLLGGGHDSVEVLWSAIKYLLRLDVQDGPLTDQQAMSALLARLVVRDSLAGPESIPPPF